MRIKVAAPKRQVNPIIVSGSGHKMLSSIDSSILWPLPLTMIGFTCLFGAAMLMRMRAELAEAKVEARMRRMAS